ncbi:hypothetical protein [Cellvibrio japonicus]|uniref:Uncharacterized protein n=1 Tax=Cellvibrio japonicus (strain Ueda107) TaxID=498211 RepID=B3PDZ8_CELJU|nr:hypothetical protein [Cellvibrio japonicus]ACE82932.1 hypothetical protein CJA_3201 [Cellvibrio japonicus Ueda107]QEI13482.1 hypothetical protein FY117_15445 [Cellvibrio japonicus]QEI17056.1 hypothetical protein FY116_15450 [Cellvibrio japonicus]QEI20634.1 hypothetical protein FY115_15445 [Cellvibrio japonicus]
MHILRNISCILLMIITSSAIAHNKDASDSFSISKSDLKEIQKLEKNHIKKHSNKSQDSSVTFYETVLPHNSQQHIPKSESAILVAYLDNPNNVNLAKINAAYHLLVLQVNGLAHGKNVKVKIDSLKRAIYAQYFLHRAKRLGAKDAWINNSIKETNRLLKKWLPQEGKLDFAEQTHAQLFFFRSFTLNEADRYKADHLLLEEILEKPRNLLTNMYVSAVNLWNGSEADYADPTMLYSYIICSYFAERIEALAQQAQSKWIQNPSKNPLFRVVTSIGGFTLPARRWLAKLHKDENTVNRIDEEMLEWLEIYPEFYAWPATVIPMQEPDKFYFAVNGYLAGVQKCTTTPSRVCGNTNRGPFNVISFHLLGMDLALRLGDMGWFNTLLTFENVPEFHYNTWYLKHEAWDIRKANVEDISTRYHNDDPSDDPVNAFIKTQKWGVSSTCQSCHQNQGLYVSDADRDAIPARLGEDRLYIPNWPAYTATWYAEPITNN